MRSLTRITPAQLFTRLVNQCLTVHCPPAARGAGAARPGAPDGDGEEGEEEEEEGREGALGPKGGGSGLPKAAAAAPGAGVAAARGDGGVLDVLGTEV
jgi:hypothetical protein